MRTRKTNKWAKVTIPCPNCGCGCDVDLGDSDEDDIISISSDSDVELENEPARKKIRRETEAPESSPSGVVLEPKVEPKVEPKEEPRSQSNIRTFFSQFSRFNYEPSQPLMPQFQELCKMEFPPASQQLRRARQDFKEAMVLDFNALYGTDLEDLGAWQSLCRVLRFSPVPDELEACQRLVQATYVNIVDLIETELTGKPVKHFDSEKELAFYTVATEKFLPRNHPRAGGFLKFLLRDILCPGSADRANPDPLRGLTRRR